MTETLKQIFIAEQQGYKQYNKSLEGIIKNNSIIDRQAKNSINTEKKLTAEKSKLITKLKQVAQEQSKVNQQVKNSQNQVISPKLGKSVDTLNQKFNRLRWTMVNIGFVLSTLAIPVLFMKKMADMQFEAEKAGILLKTTSESIVASIKDIQTESTASFEDVSKSFQELGKSGFTFAESQNIVKASTDLSILGFASLDDSVSIVSQTIKQFGFDSNTASGLVTQLINTVNAGKIDVEDLGQALKFAGGQARLSGQDHKELLSTIAVLSNTGMKATQIGRGLSRAYSNITNQTDRAKATFERFNVETIDSNGNMRSLVDIVDDLDASMAGLSSSQKAAVIGGIFDAASGRVILNMMTNVDNINKGIKEMNDVSGQLANKWKSLGTQSSIMTREWESIKTSSATFFTNVGSHFLDVFTPAANGIKAISLRMKEGKEASAEFSYNILQTAQLLEVLRGETSKGLGLDVSVDGVTGGFGTLTGWQSLSEVEIKNIKAAWIDFIDAAIADGMELDDVIKLLPISTQRWALELYNTRDIITDIPETINEISDSFIDVIDVTDLLNKSISYNTQALKIAEHHAGKYKDKIKDVESSIKDLLSQPFAGELGAQREMFDIQRQISQQKLAMLDLGDASERTTDKLRDAKNEHEAWVQTISQFMRATLEEGRDIGVNVTGIIKTFQTKLLGTSFFDTQGGAQAKSAEQLKLEGLEAQYEKLRLTFDVSYGAMRKELQLWDKEQSVAGQNLFSSVHGVKNAIVNQRDKLVELQSEYDNWNGEIETIKNSMEEARWQIFLMENGFEDMALNGTDAFNVLTNKAKDLIGEMKILSGLIDVTSNNTNGSQLYDNPRDFVGPRPIDGFVSPSSSGSGSSSGGVKRKPYIPPNQRPNSSSGGVKRKPYIPPNQRPKVVDDFILRPGQPVIKINPQDTIVGYKGDSMPSAMGGNTNVSFGNIIINGGSGMNGNDVQEQFARVVRRELARIK